MDDTISRQAAIDANCVDWCNRKHSECPYFDNVGTDEQVCDGCYTVLVLKDLPSAHPEPRWIPVMEQLPTPNVFIRNMQEYYLIQNKYGDMLVACYDGEWEQIYNPECYIDKDKVIAWMPLPKPYERR